MKMIQIRNVPDPIHGELKARAARAGKTLSDYLLEMVTRRLERPEPAEVLERMRELNRVEPSESPAEAVRAERQAR